MARTGSSDSKRRTRLLGGRVSVQDYRPPVPVEGTTASSVKKDGTPVSWRDAPLTRGDLYDMLDQLRTYMDSGGSTGGSEVVYGLLQLLAGQDLVPPTVLPEITGVTLRDMQKLIDLLGELSVLPQ